jgi:hypothetical protein
MGLSEYEICYSLGIFDLPEDSIFSDDLIRCLWSLALRQRGLEEAKQEKDTVWIRRYEPIIEQYKKRIGLAWEKIENKKAQMKFLENYCGEDRTHYERFMKNLEELLKQ